MTTRTRLASRAPLEPTLRVEEAVPEPCEGYVYITQGDAPGGFYNPSDLREAIDAAVGKEEREPEYSAKDRERHLAHIADVEDALARRKPQLRALENENKSLRRQVQHREDLIDEHRVEIKHLGHSVEAQKAEIERLRQLLEKAEGRAGNPRPLTADDITDEMVERGQEAYRKTGGYLTARAVRLVLTAALTEPPSRPEGAEELGELIGTWTASEDIAPAELPTGSLATLADFLAERGVRPTRRGPMTTDDTDALTEEIEAALWGLTRVYDAPNGHGTEVGVHAPTGDVVAAVLPIVTEEVRKAKAEAWDRAYWQGVQDEIDSQGFDGGMTGPNRINPYRETGDSDEHR